MDLEKLKAEHPDLVQAIRNEALAEGAAQERARIQAIEDIATPGHEDLVNEAKFKTGISAEALAVSILKAEKKRAAQMLQDRADDAKDLAKVSVVDSKDSINDNKMPDLQASLADACNKTKENGGL